MTFSGIDQFFKKKKPDFFPDKVGTGRGGVRVRARVIICVYNSFTGIFRNIPSLNTGTIRGSRKNSPNSMLYPRQ